MKKAITAFIFIMPLAVVPWAIATGYMEVRGIVVVGNAIFLETAFSRLKEANSF